MLFKACLELFFRGKEVKSKLVEKPLLYVWYICHVSSFCQVLYKLAQVRVLQRVKKKRFLQQPKTLIIVSYKHLNLNSAKQ